MIPHYLRGSESSGLPTRALRLFLADGALAGVTNAYVDTFLPLFALALGATATQLGLLISLSHLLGPATYLAGGYLAERSSKHQRIYAITEGLLGRGTILVYVLVPLLFHGNAAVWAIICLQIVRMTFFRLAGPALTAVTGTVVPSSLRGRFMSTRSLAASIGEMAIQPLAGMIIVSFAFPRGYQYGFLLASLLGMVGGLAFIRMPVPSAKTAEQRLAKEPMRGIGRDLRNDRRFLAFLLAVFAWSLGEHVASPFYSMHMVRNLALDARAVGFLAGAAGLGTLIGLPLVGLLSDRHSNRLALVVTAIILAVVPLGWLAARGFWALVPLFLLTGLAARGFRVALPNLLLAIAPMERYARYSALYQAVEAAMSVVGPLWGSYLFTRTYFGGNLIVAAGTMFAVAAVAWRYIRDRPAVAPAGP